MPIALLDFLLDKLTFDCLPPADQIIIICSSNCKVSSVLLEKFSLSSELNTLKNGGNFIAKAQNEIQRGLLLAFLSKTLNPQIFSHRSESLKKMINFQNITQLKTPEKPAIKVKKVKKDKSPEEVLDALSVYKKIYADSLEKYVQMVLTTPSRAEKSRSAKAQIKNIVEGIIVSVKKKGNVLAEFSADELSAAITADLEGNRILSIDKDVVKYDEVAIEETFGATKKRVFVSNCVDSSVGLKVKSNAEEEEKNMSDCEKILYENCVKGSKFMSSRTIGELGFAVQLELRLCENLFGIEIDLLKDSDIVDRVTVALINEFFLVQGLQIKEIADNIHYHFAAKLIKKPFN